MESKSPKELAFLHDLYVATDWGERFAAIVDEHVVLPKKGRALYVAAGTGGHALALQQRAGKKLRFLAVDESEDCLELARAKAVVLNEETEFQHESSVALSFPDDQFDLVLGDGSLVAPVDVPEMISEIVRVAKPGTTVAFWLPTSSSFGEFFSIFWEATYKAGLEDQSLVVEDLISELPIVSAVEEWCEREGLDGVTSWTVAEDFDYESGEQFVNAPLIADFLFPHWLTSVPAAAHARVVSELVKVIDAERYEAKFVLSVKATLVVGKKRRA